MSNNYFMEEDSITYPSRQEIVFYHRNHRRPIPGFSYKQAVLEKPHVALQFFAGDVITVTLCPDAEGFSFTGICLAVRRGRFLTDNCTVILRNVLWGVGVELVLSLFSTRAYRVRFEDHLRKSFFYNKTKLFYLKKLPGNQPTRS